MKYEVKEIKKGIKFHTINTDKFKTNLFAIFLSVGLNRENVTKNALVSMLLRRGSKTMKSQEEISKKMEELYGASFDCGLDKTGNNQVLKFYIESINDNYLPEHNENTLKTVIDSLLEIVFDPYIEDLDSINEKKLYEYYIDLINTCKIDIFLSGNLSEDLDKIIEGNENIKKLKEREPKFEIPKIPEKREIKENIITESMEVTQGKLVIGLNVNIDNDEEKYTTLMYNSILGGSANSKLFQNVREKAHLAYVASSTYYRFKSIIFINSGIEISNYDKALELIRKQIEEMKNGNFTEEEIENSKKGIIAAINTIDDEQDTGITYYFGQELSNSNVSEEEYIKKIENINKKDIVDIANKVQINTIYFLKD